MTREIVTLDKITSFIRKRKATTFHEIEEHFKCSRMTVFRKIRHIQYLTSYNQNGSGVTLIEIPIFNEFGIWEYKKFLFSKWGTIKNTIPNIVDLSLAGLYAKDLEDILKVRVNNHISMCVKNDLIVRNNDFGPPIYLSTKPEVRRSQYDQRTVLYSEQARPEKAPVSKENTIRILATALKHHETSPDKIVSFLEMEGIHLGKRSVEWVFRKYGIQKKTPDNRS